MSNTQWISVNERMPGGMCNKIIRAGGVTTGLAYLGFDSKWRDPYAHGEVLNVTHWMDLPEPPAPPKPADPFEAYWDANKETVFWRTSTCHAAKQVWNAAKAHYERPLPDFEAWRKANGGPGPCCVIVRGQKNFVFEEVARSIWNAAQGKPEA